MVVQHNLLSMNAARQFSLVGKNKAKSSEKLASGYRVNRAADDAAGLAISEKIRTQVRGLHRASDNLQDGISYVQTADGALSQVSDMLQRMRELSVQASNVAVNTEEDRQKIQDEISEVRKEINRVFTDTEFNKKKIWDPNRTDAEPKIVGYETQKAVRMQVNGNSSANMITNDNRNTIPRNSGYRLQTDDDGIIVKWTGYDGVNYESNKVPWPAEGAATSNSFNLADYLDQTDPKFQGISLPISYSVNEEATNEEVVSALNGVYISNYTSSSEYMQLYGQSGNVLGSPFSYSVSINYDAEIASNRDMETGDTSFIRGTTTNLTTPSSDSDKWIFSFDMDGIGTVKATSTQMTYYINDTRDEKEGQWWDWAYHTVNGVREKYRGVHTFRENGTLAGMKDITANTNGISVLNDTNSSYSGTLTMSFSLTSDSSYTNGPYTTNSVGSMTISMPIYGGDTHESIRNRFEQIKGADIYNSARSNNDGAALSSTSRFGYGKNTSSYKDIQVPVYEYEGYIKEWVQAGANELQGINLDYRYLHGNVLGIKNTKVETLEDAQKAIGDIDGALSIVSEERSRFGAYQNRFEYSIKVDDITEENLADAESRIRDTDMAEEMTRLAKENILEQAGLSMLSRANQQNQTVLSLLE